MIPAQPLIANHPVEFLMSVRIDDLCPVDFPNRQSLIVHRQ
jgi:hypothetical protein